MVHLTVGFTDNPRIAPLVDGTVKTQNIQLGFVLVAPPGELFYRNLKYDEFDVFEMSLSEYLIVREKHDSSRWQWIALPIFFAKTFQWLDLYVNTDAKITGLGDLKGKRLGVPDYSQTAALWLRIVLKEVYGIRPKDIHWYIGRTKEFSHGTILGLDQEKGLEEVPLTWLTEEKTFDRMLDAGDIDATYGFLPHPDPMLRSFGSRYSNVPIQGNPKIRKLFSDGGRRIITEYHQKTGVLPANHTVVVQDRILKQHPWVALELFKAFRKSKEIAYERASRMRSTYLLFEGDDYKNQASIFGDDPYALGIRDNKKMLEKLIQGSYEDGLTKMKARLEDLFYISTLDS